MNKISLNNLDNLGIERLSKEKLKSVLGGVTLQCETNFECSGNRICCNKVCTIPIDNGCPDGGNPGPQCVDSCGGITGNNCGAQEICQSTGCTDHRGHHSIQQCFHI